MRMTRLLSKVLVAVGLLAGVQSANAADVAKVGETGYETLAAAVAAATTGQTVEIIQAGTYTLPAIPLNITIKGTVSGVNFDTKGSAGNIAAIPNACTFENVSLDCNDQVNYRGFQSATPLVFKNCTFEGEYWSYGNETFDGCTFHQVKATSGNRYALYIYGGTLVTLKDCTFNTDGKAVKIAKDNSAAVTVKATNCTFNSTLVNKNAFMYDTQHSAITVIADGCTFDANYMSSSCEGGAGACWNEYSSSGNEGAAAVGTGIVLDANNKVVGGTLTQYFGETILGEGCSVTDNGNGTWTVQGADPLKPEGAFKIGDGFYQNGATYAASTEFYITNLNGLKLFRDIVNKKLLDTDYYPAVLRGSVDYTNQLFANKTVKLLADVDLGNEEWEPIGNQYDFATKAELSGKHYFYGVFDGCNHTISNLKIHSTAYNAAKKDGAALFGRCAAGAVFKNLTIHNVDIEASSYVAALCGNYYSSGVGVIENCHVTGSIAISGASTVGGFLGIGAAAMTDCSVVATGIGTIAGSGWQVGGVIGAVRANSVITATVQNLTVSAANSDPVVGGIAGTVNGANAKITGCALTDVTVTGTGSTKGAVVGKIEAVGAVVSENTPKQAGQCGTMQDSSVVGWDIVYDANDKITGGTFESCAASAIASGYQLYAVTPATTPATYTVEQLKVAQIGETKYATLAAAIAAVGEMEGKTATIQMLANETINGNTGVTIPADCTITLDLNGKTITGNVTESSTAFVIDNYGTLTIKDTAEGGKITNTIAEGVQSGDPANGRNYCHNVIRNNGNLAIQGGIVENTINGSACYAVDCNSSGGHEITFTMTGGTLKQANYTPLRLAPTNTKSVTATISGGTIEGTYGIVVNGNSQTAPMVSLTVTGGTIKAKDYALYQSGANNVTDTSNVNLSVSGGTWGNGAVTSGEALIWTPALGTGFISGGTFTENVNDYAAADYKAVDNGNGNWSVVAKNYVAQVGTTKFETLAEAVAAAQANDEIKLLANNELGSAVAINKNVTIDFNGFSITSTGTALDVTASAIGLKGANINAGDVAVEFENDAVLTVVGENVFTASAGGIVADEGLTIAGTDDETDLLTINAPGKVAIEILGDDFTADKVGITFNAKRGIVAQEDQTKITIDITDATLVGGNTVERLIQSWPYNGAIEVTIDGSVLTGYGALMIESDSTSKKQEDVSVTIKDSQLTLTGLATNASGMIEVLATYGDVTLTIDNSSLDLTQNNDEMMVVNVGTCFEKNGHGLAKGIIRNHSTLELSGGVIGYNIWTWAGNNTKGTVLDIDDSTLIIDNEGYFGIEAYAYGNAAPTVVTIDNSTVEISGSSEGIVMGLNKSYNAHTGALNLNITDSELTVGDVETGIYMSTASSEHDITYTQTDSNVSLSGDYAFYALGGVEEYENPTQKTQVTITGGSFDASGYVGIFGDAEGRLTMNTDATFDSEVEYVDLYITGGKYVLGANAILSGYGTDNVTGGLFNEDMEFYVADNFECVANTDPATSAIYPYAIAVAPVAQIGETTYTSINAAFAAVNSQAGDEVEIKILRSFSEDWTDDYFLAKGVTLTTDVEGGVVLSLNPTSSDFGSVIENVAGKLTIGEGVKISEFCQVFAGYGNGVNTIDILDDIKAYQIWTFDGGIVNVGAKAKVEVEDMVKLRYDGTINIVGDGSDEVQFDCDYFSGDKSGVRALNLVDTCVTAGALSESGTGSFTLSLENSMLQITLGINLGTAATGTINMKIDSQIVAQSLVNVNAINIDATGITEPVKVIDLTGNTAMTLADYGTVTVTGGEAYVEDNDLWVKKPSVAQIGETKYATLQAAIDAAHEMTGDVTINLIGDTKECVLVHQKEGLNLTIDGDNKTHTITGQIIIDGNGRQNGTDTITITGVNFTGTLADFVYSDAFVVVPDNKTDYSGRAYSYAHNVTISNCSFTGDDANPAGMVVFKSLSNGGSVKNLTISGVEATKVHSLAQLTSSIDVTVSGCTLTDAENGVNISGGNGNYVFENNSFSANTTDGYGIRLKDGTTVVATIKSGNTITAANALVLGKKAEAENQGKFVVEGGTFNGSLGKITTSADATYTITGGTFSERPAAAYIAPGYEAVDNGNGTYTVQQVMVAQIGETKYATLAAAIAAVPANTETTIVMIHDEEINTNAGVTIPAGKNIILDLNGKTISQVAPDAAGSYLIKNNGTLTVKDSTATTVNDVYTSGRLTAYATVSQNSGNYTIENWGTLTIESGIVENTTSVSAIFYALNTCAGATANISGGLLKCTSTTIRQVSTTTAENKLNITGGTIESGYYAVQIFNLASAMHAHLNISGGNLSTTSADNMVVYVYAYYTDFSNVFVDISGGTFDGDVKFTRHMPAANITISDGMFENVSHYDSSVDGFITGGTFDLNGLAYWGYQSLAQIAAQPAPWNDVAYWESCGYVMEWSDVYDDYEIYYPAAWDADKLPVADGYMTIDLGNNIYTVRPVVAKIGTTGYETLMDAVMAAQDGATIEVLDGTWGADAVGSLTTSEQNSVRGKSLTIQPAEGATVKFTSRVYLGYDSSQLADASMTVKDIAFEGATLTIGDYARVTVDGCSFVGATAGASGALAVLDSGVAGHLTTGDYGASQVTITNCTFDGGPANNAIVRVRNTGNVTITGNTIANSHHNGILIEGTTAAAESVVIADNEITNWNCDNVDGGGRGMRVSLGNLTSVSAVSITNNVLRKEQLGNDTPDFVKITGVGPAAVDISHNDWNDLMLCEVKGNSAIYTCDAAATITDVITTHTLPQAYVTEDPEMAAEHGLDVAYKFCVFSDADLAIYNKIVAAGGFDHINEAGLTAEELAHVNEMLATLEYFYDWHGDFVVTFDQDIPAGSIQLSGQYTVNNTWYDGSWVSFTNPEAIPANTPVRLLATMGVTESFLELLTDVVTFNCGVLNLDAPEGTKMTVELRLYPATGNGLENELSGEGITAATTDTYEYTLPAPALCCQIGETKYTSLAEAVAAVPTTGAETTITMIANHEITSNDGVTIPAGKNVVLDLNGFTVSQMAPDAETSFLIVNNGTLTINDSSEVRDGNGQITTEGTGKLIAECAQPSAAYAYANNTISNYGTLTVNAGYIKSNTYGPCYCIDNYSGGNTTINGGYLYNFFGNALRMFCNNSSADNVVTINGGTIDGYGALWLQNANDGDLTKGNLRITGGHFKTTEKAVVNGTKTIGEGSSYMQLETGYDSAGNNNMTVSIEGGTFDVNIALFVSNTAKDTGNLSISGGKFAGWIYSNTTKKFVTGGIYADDEDLDGYVVDGYAVAANTDDETKDAYPYMIIRTGFLLKETVEGNGVADVMIAWDWVEGNVANAADKTDAELETALVADQANGVKAWMNYVMGIDGTDSANTLLAKFKKATGSTAAAPKTTVCFNATGTPPANTGVAVTYTLLTSTNNGASWTEGTSQGTSEFTIDMPAANTLYRIKVDFAPAQ